MTNTYSLPNDIPSPVSVVSASTVAAAAASPQQVSDLDAIVDDTSSLSSVDYSVILEVFDNDDDQNEPTISASHATANYVSEQIMLNNDRNQASSASSSSTTQQSKASPSSSAKKKGIYLKHQKAQLMIILCQECVPCWLLSDSDDEKIAAVPN